MATSLEDYNPLVVSWFLDFPRSLSSALLPLHPESQPPPPASTALGKHHCSALLEMGRLGVTVPSFLLALTAESLSSPAFS